MAKPDAAPPWNQVPTELWHGQAQAVSEPALHLQARGAPDAGEFAWRELRVVLRVGEARLGPEQTDQAIEQPLAIRRGGGNPAARPNPRAQ